MPVLRNDRYNTFEYGVPRDELRGIPLTKFPWALENEIAATFSDELQWQLRIDCTHAYPSGFGSKLCFELQVCASLMPDSIQKLGFGKHDNERVRHLFRLERFALVETESVKAEGALEELPKIASELKKTFLRRLKEEWPPIRVQKHLKAQFQLRSPGGFGERGN